MSNLLKGRYTYVKEDETRVIDTNELMAKKLEEHHARMQAAEESDAETDEDGFTSGLGAEHLGILLEDQVEMQEATEDEESFEEPVEEMPTPEELFNEAQEEITLMKQRAAQEIEAERQRVLEEAQAVGYEEGVRRAEAEYQAKEQALYEQAAQLEAEYQALIDELEPQFIATLTGVYEHIFNVDLGRYHDVLVHLIASTIRKTEGCKEFVVRVSCEDYPYVSMQKKRLQGVVNLPGSFVEVVEDLALRKNECMIETGSGIYDCSLGTELEELSVKLKLLSYERPE